MMSTQVPIDDILPYTQIVANIDQTVFSTDWTANAATDVVVYYTPLGDVPNDLIQKLQSSQFNVAFIGGDNIVQVTLVTPAVNTGDIVTITRNTPADRENLYINTNFTPTMLNQDFGILTLVDQQAQLVNQMVGPRYNYSATITNIADTILPILLPGQTWAKNSSGTGIVGVTIGAAIGATPTDLTLPFVSSADGPFTPGNIVVAGDTLGTLIDGGELPNVSSGSINELAWYQFGGTGVSGLATANNGILVTSNTGVPSISSTLPAAVQQNITVTGAVTGTSFNTFTGMANKAAQIAAISTTLATNPAVQQNHPSAAKFWVDFFWTGSIISVLAQYNVTSVTRTAVGTYQINFMVPFTSGEWIPFISGLSNTTITGQATAITNNSITVGFANIPVSSVDPTRVYVGGFGLQ